MTQITLKTVLADPPLSIFFLQTLFSVPFCESIKMINYVTKFFGQPCPESDLRMACP